jgi:hypothetical protein
MSTSRPPGIDRQNAEHLLDGTGGMDRDQLPWILAAATTPGHDTELAREEAAVAAFQAHLLSPFTTSASGQTVKSPLARLLTAKVLTAAAAVLAAGGVALAASTGVLTGHSPAPVHSGASHYSSTVQASPATRLATAPGQTAAGSPSPGATLGRGAGGSTATLCRDLASRAGVTGTARPAALTQALASPVMSPALASPAFSRLTGATGRVATVPDYCALVLALPRLPQPALVGELPPAVLARALTSLAPPSLATVLTSLRPAPLAQTLTSLPDPALASVLATLPAAALGTVLTTLPPRSLARVLTRLQPTTASRILGELPASVLSQLSSSALAKLPPSVLAKLPPSVLATLPTSVLAKLPPSVLATLPASVLAQLPVG